MGDVKPDNWLNSSITPFLSLALPIRSWLDWSFSLAIMVSITLFTDGSVGIAFLCWLSDFFLKLYLSPILLRKCLMVSILNDISFADLIGWGHLKCKGSHWEHVVTYIVAKFVCVVVFFVDLLCWVFWFGICCCCCFAIVMKGGSSALVAQACLPHGFELSNT